MARTVALACCLLFAAAGCLGPPESSDAAGIPPTAGTVSSQPGGPCAHLFQGDSMAIQALAKFAYEVQGPRTLLAPPLASFNATLYFKGRPVVILAESRLEEDGCVRFEVPGRPGNYSIGAQHKDPLADSCTWVGSALFEHQTESLHEVSGNISLWCSG